MKGDVVRQVAPLFEKVRITGSGPGLRVEAHTEDKMLFSVADVPADVPELAGEFGIRTCWSFRGRLDHMVTVSETGCDSTVTQ